MARVFAEIGDTIACDVRIPRRETIAMRLVTTAAVLHANKLLIGGQGWRLVRNRELPAEAPSIPGHLRPT